LIKNANSDTIFVDHSTVELEFSLRCHKESELKKCHFIDAPISGGPVGAKQGTLTIMCGGKENAFQKAKDIFSAMGTNVVYMGEPGSGTSTKLVNQLLTSAHVLISCEALLLAKSCNLDFTKLQSVLLNSYGNSKILQRNIPKIQSGDYLKESNAPLRHLVKDLSFVSKLSSSKGLSLPATETTNNMFCKALDESLGDKDITGVYTLLERLSSQEK